MSRTSISIANELFYGKGAYGRANGGLRGISVALMTRIALGAPIASDGDGFINDATSTELPNNETVTYTFPAANVSPTDEALRDGIIDVPRNLVAVVTHGSSIVAMTILVTGTDAYGETVVELLTVTATGTSKTVNGLKAFKTITSVAITSAGNAESNTLNLGTGGVFGLPVRVGTNGLFAARGANAADTGTFVPAVTTSPATNVTGDVRGTFAPSTTLNGSNEIDLYVQVEDPKDKVSAYGVAQFGG